MPRSVYSVASLSERWNPGSRPFIRSSSEWVNGKRKPSLQVKDQAVIDEPFTVHHNGRLLFCPATFNPPPPPKPKPVKKRQLTEDEQRALRALAIIEHRRKPVTVAVVNPLAGFAGLVIA